jgi:glycolate oxidase FAD binding subunit
MRFAGAAAGEQAAAASAAMRELGLEDAAVMEDDDAVWEAQRAAQRGPCVLKVAGRISDLPAVCRTGAAVAGRAGLGLYWLQLEPERERIAEVREAMHPRACTLLDAPKALRDQTWPAADPGVLAVMERLKQRFDPARAFRPGAFVGGL